MSIDKDKIKHVSKLARISVDEKKIDDLTKDLSSIFKFIEQLNELNTDKVTPLSSILNEPLRSRKDEINDGKIRDKILENSPKKNEHEGLSGCLHSTTLASTTELPIDNGNITICHARNFDTSSNT